MQKLHYLGFVLKVYTKLKLDSRGRCITKIKIFVILEN
jgi:hypothetical protein